MAFTPNIGVPINKRAVDNITHGTVNTTFGTPKPLVATALKCLGVYFYTDPGAPQDLFFGDSSAQPHLLLKGTGFWLPIKDANLLYIDSVVANVTVNYMIFH